MFVVNPFGVTISPPFGRSANAANITVDLAGSSIVRSRSIQHRSVGKRLRLRAELTDCSAVWWQSRQQPADAPDAIRVRFSLSNSTHVEAWRITNVRKASRALPRWPR